MTILCDMIQQHWLQSSSEIIEWTYGHINILRGIICNRKIGRNLIIQVQKNNAMIYKNIST